MKKTELYGKLSRISDAKLKELNITKDELNFLKEKLSQHELGLKLDFTELDKEDLENYYVFKEEKNLAINLKEESKNNHLLIEGDNFYALKALKVAGVKVDIIYIDPPYNTGKDFVYKDDFGTIKTVGGDDPHKHSKWLSFMKKRLKIAKELLSDEGVIFVSIDDNEQAYLKVLMDDIFDNFISSLPRVTRKGGKTDSMVVSELDYVLVYSIKSVLDQFGDMDTNGKNYKYKDENFEERGFYQTKPLDVSSLTYSKNMDYIIVDNDGKEYFAGGENNFRERERGIVSTKDWTWRWSREKLNFALKNGFAFFKNGKIQTKIYENKIISNTKPYFIIDKNLVQKVGNLHFANNNNYSNYSSKKELDNIFGNKVFEHPKPTSLISNLIKLISEKRDITVLDFFAGSGTTGQAVMELNSEDGGNRRFILCTNNEMKDVDTKVHPEKGIARAITRERLFRVVNGKGSKGEIISWKSENDLSNNSINYLTLEQVNKVNGEYEQIDNKKDLYEKEFDKKISIEDFE